LKKDRTFLNWFKWNLRGRPRCLIVERGGIGQDGRVVENNVYVPDYLVDEYWRYRTTTKPKQMSETQDWTRQGKNVDAGTFVFVAETEAVAEQIKCVHNAALATEQCRVEAWKQIFKQVHDQLNAEQQDHKITKAELAKLKETK
jgi:hypothetical protein